MDTPAPPAQRTSLPLVVLGVLLVALALRGPVVAVAPVVGQLSQDLGIGLRTTALLTSVPVLCFALAAPPASALIARLGPDLSLLVAAVGVLAGSLVRSSGGLFPAFAGTVLLGLAITVGNVVVPVVISRDCAGRVGLVTGAYTASLNFGSMTATAVTAPLALAAGWRGALLLPAVWVVLTVPVWVVASRGRLHRVPTATRHAAARSGASSVWKRPEAWLLLLAFAGQGFSYYAVTAWLPTLLADELGVSAATAGTAASVFQVFAIGGAFGVPALAAWWGRLAPVLLLVCGAWLVLPVGLLLAPQWWPAWSAVGGVAQGGGLVVVFIAVVQQSREEADARRLSAMVQGGGYAVAAVGPYVVGAVHEATGGWTAPLLVVAVALLVMAGTGAAAVRHRAPAPS
ncbi:MFS transporter [Kineococcus rubinsiae]|uniref:MFS transporter n=1 Tax=Kineococcus rubinsiae TaxID=2609562 RepID=UPI0014320CA0|nr:MFS transporter [Kineococcus rubinsiae]NIZ89555.1 MFS transporter [Kineococcus rubinsiae]